MPDRLAVFDALYRASPDPWGTTTRWYERRKRMLLMAALPHERYRSAYEAGCGTGHISAALAERCDRLLASDGSRDAVDLATARLAGHDNVAVALHRLPEDWPDGRFDLIVLSEVLYFVDDAACAAVAAASRDGAGCDGLVVACNWRDVIDGHGHSGDAVHRRFEARLGLPKIFEYLDADFVLGGWSADPTTVAMREGLREGSR